MRVAIEYTIDDGKGGKVHVNVSVKSFLKLAYLMEFAG